MFPCEIWENFKKSFFNRTLPVAAFEAHHSLLKVSLFCILSFSDYVFSRRERFLTFDIDMQLLKATAFVMLPCRSTMHTVKKNFKFLGQ